MSCFNVESEYKGHINVVAKVTWIESILNELCIYHPHPPLLFFDNINTTYLVVNLVLHNQTKHVEIDYHCIYERVMHRTLTIQYTASKDQPDNAMTMPLPSSRICNLRYKLTVLPGPLNLREDVKPI